MKIAEGQKLFELKVSEYGVEVQKPEPDGAKLALLQRQLLELDLAMRVAFVSVDVGDGWWSDLYGAPGS